MVLSGTGYGPGARSCKHTDEVFEFLKRQVMGTARHSYVVHYKILTLGSTGT